MPASRRRTGIDLSTQPTLGSRSEELLPPELTSSPRSHVLVTGRTRSGQVQARLEAAVAKVWPTATVVDHPEDADLALFEDDREGMSLSIDPRDNGVDVDRIQRIEQTVPTILVVNLTNPWLLGEIEPAAETVVGTFEITPENLLASLAGRDGGPAGGLPMTLPASFRVVADSPRDVPGKFCGDAYPYLDREGVSYGYGHGLRL